MKLRIGTWVVALVLCIQVVIGTAEMATFGVSQVLHGPLAVPWPLAALRIAGGVTQLALVAGLVWCSLSGDRLSRRWFAVAAIAGLAAPIATLFVPAGDVARWLQAGVIVSACCFAWATSTFETRRLVYSLYGVAALLGIAIAFAPHRAWIGTIALVIDFALQLLWCFLAFHLLAGFPEDSDAPTARVASRARSGVTYASLAFCLSGLGLLAVALWQNQRAGFVRDHALVFVGIGVFIAGTTALRRTRLQSTTIKRPVIVTFVLYLISAMLLDETRARPATVPLATHDVPGLRIALPVGRIAATSSTDRARGSLVVRPSHTLIGPTTLAWHTGPLPENENYKPKHIGERATVRSSWMQYNEDLHVATRWACAKTRWFELSVSIGDRNTFNASDRDAQLDRLIERIVGTLECTSE